MSTLESILGKCKDGRNLDPHEIAHCFIELMEEEEMGGIIKIVDAYLGDLTKKKKMVDREARALVNENLAYASRLADEIVRCGYDASGQLLTEHKDGGPVAEFYRRAIASEAQS